MLWLAKQAVFRADRRTSSVPEPLLSYPDDRTVHRTHQDAWTDTGRPDRPTRLD